MRTHVHQDVQKRIQVVKTNQLITEKGIIKIKSHQWFARFAILGLACFAVAISIQIGIELNEPALLYVSVLPIHGILYLLIGWILYRNPATGEPGKELVSVIIPVYNQE